MKHYYLLIDEPYQVADLAEHDTETGIFHHTNLILNYHRTFDSQVLKPGYQEITEEQAAFIQLWMSVYTAITPHSTYFDILMQHIRTREDFQGI